MALLRRRNSASPEDSLWELNALIAQVTLEDINELENGRKRKGKEGAPLTDEEIAFQLYAEEAHTILNYVQDYYMAQSIALAIHTDSRLLKALEDEEVVANEDREYALALSQGREPPPRTFRSPPATITAPQPARAPTTAPASTLANPLSLLSFPRSYQSRNEGSSSTEVKPMVLFSGRSSAPKASTSSHASKAVECTICGDEIRGTIIKAPCGTCSYDTSCLKELYTRATMDESLFPPRCCQKPFELVDVQTHLGLTLTREFKKKAIEFSTPNRVYCHQPHCSKFLGPVTKTIRFIQCSNCLSSTCSSCKQKYHYPLPCTTTQDAEVIALGDRNGWKRCPSCHQLIELSVGCYHMTCRCRHEFCYLCAATWKRCQCVQWDENRLIEAAEVRVQRGLNQNRRVPAAPAFQQMVQREAQRLREDHDCRHYMWNRRNGGGNCETCGFWLRDFLLQCRECRMLACVRCRRNRL